MKQMKALAEIHAEMMKDPEFAAIWENQDSEDDLDIDVHFYPERMLELMDNEPPNHPGEIVGELLELLDVTADSFAQNISTPIEKVNSLIAGFSPLTLQLARLISRALVGTPDVWMQLQAIYELSKPYSKEEQEQLAKVVQYVSTDYIEQALSH